MDVRVIGKACDSAGSEQGIKMSKTFTNKEVFGRLQESGTSEGAKKGWQSRHAPAIDKYGFKRGSGIRKEIASLARDMRGMSPAIRYPSMKDRNKLIRKDIRKAAIGYKKELGFAKKHPRSYFGRLS
jgi:hypothetical protein